MLFNKEVLTKFWKLSVVCIQSLNFDSSPDWNCLVEGLHSLNVVV